MVNFYHRFIPSAATTLQPLFRALEGKKKTLVWTSEMDTAFNISKQAVADATMLIHPCANVPIALTVDASDVAVGAVLEQQVGNVWRPLAFFSRQLIPSQQKYSAFNLELPALCL